MYIHMYIYICVHIHINSFSPPTNSCAKESHKPNSPHKTFCVSKCISKSPNIFLQTSQSLHRKETLLQNESSTQILHKRLHRKETLWWSKPHKTNTNTYI